MLFSLCKKVAEPNDSLLDAFKKTKEFKESTPEEQRVLKNYSNLGVKIYDVELYLKQMKCHAEQCRGLHEFFSAKDPSVEESHRAELNAEYNFLEKHLTKRYGYPPDDGCTRVPFIGFFGTPTSELDDALEHQKLVLEEYIKKLTEKFPGATMSPPAAAAP